MNAGERLQTARKLRGMTQQDLGFELHFEAHSARTRIAQYETGIRKPKKDLIERMAEILNVNPKALSGPTGYKADDVMYMLFDLEDEGYDIEICKIKEDLIVKIKHPDLNGPLEEWKTIRAKVRSNKMSEEEYRTWQFDWVFV